LAEVQANAAQNLTGLFAEYAANITYESLPSEVVSVLKRMVLDTLGTTLAANTLGEGVKELVRVVRSAGGSPESTLIGFGEKVPAVMAALANGGMAHSLNYDDSGEAGGHLGATAIPAALAAAERVGGVSGKEFLVALAAGTELMSRFGVAIARAEESEARSKVLGTQVFGYFSAAVSAGRVMKLTTQEMHSALGLALMQASGTMQVVLEGDPPAKAIYTAFSNQGGMLSALLSKEGLRADCAAFEGNAGLFNLYYNGKYYHPALHSELGEKFYVLGLRFKPWPTTGVVHPFIEAALQLMDNHNIEIADIDQVLIRGGPHVRRYCEPIALRQEPENGASAANSVFFAVAKALANREVTLADFTPDGLRQQEANQLTKRMIYSIDSALGRSGIVEITTVAGQQYNCRIDKALGHPSKPLSYPRLVEKFLDCAQYAAHRIPKPMMDEIIETIENLEQAPDIGLLPGLLSGLGRLFPSHSSNSRCDRGSK